jgi:catechol 2,3-dioxygenase-like lactoylglutathione lyase family enzyme
MRLPWPTCAASVLLFSLAGLLAQAQSRPPITSLAHVGILTSNMAKANEFYGHVLGLEHFSLDKPGGGLMLNYYKINDHQYIEVYPGLKGDEDRLTHVAFVTTDARKLRDDLASKGVHVPASLEPGLDGNLSFEITAPGGRTIEFVQYLPGSLHERKFGKLLGPNRISKHMIHAGFVVHDRVAEDRLFRDILGFQLMWHGGMTDSETDWMDMRVPNGTNWIEYMVNVHHPSVRTRGVMNHFSLGVKNIHAAYRKILARGYKPPHPPQIGRDGKWQLNLYDPDSTRVELMEFKPVQKPCCSPMLSR